MASIVSKSTVKEWNGTTQLPISQEIDVWLNRIAICG